MNTPIRYFVLNEKTPVMHIYGYCRQTKNRDIPIRLFDSREALCSYAGRPLRLCNCCQTEWNVRMKYSFGRS